MAEITIATTDEIRNAVRVELTAFFSSFQFQSDGYELIKYLVSRGLVTCTGKVGWSDDVFLLPDESIGAQEHSIVYQPEYATAHKLRTKETLEQCQPNISKYCVGNSRLTYRCGSRFCVRHTSESGNPKRRFSQSRGTLSRNMQN